MDYRQNWFSRTKILLLVLFVYNTYLCIQFLNIVWAWEFASLDTGIALLLVITYLSPPAVSLYAYLTSERSIRRLMRSSQPGRVVSVKIFKKCVRLLNVTTPTRLRILDASYFNAFAFGNKNLGTVVVTRGLIDGLSNDELKGVFTHELTHIKNGDYSIMTWTNSLVRVYRKALPVYLVLSVLTVYLETVLDVGSPIWLSIHALTTTMMVFVLPTLIVNALSRNREYLADRAAFSATSRFPTALFKLAMNFRSQTGIERLSLLAEHSHRNRIWSLLESHPPIKDRITRMRSGDVPAVFHTFDYFVIGVIVSVSAILLNEMILSSTLSVFALIPSALPPTEGMPLRISLAIILAKNFESWIYLIEILVPVSVLFAVIPSSQFESFLRLVGQSLAVCAGLLCLPFYYLLPEQGVTLGLFPMPQKIWPTGTTAFSYLVYSALGYFAVLCALSVAEWILVSILKPRIAFRRKS